ncbi:MAG: hypothetical protein R3E44_13445 [Paracoccaceae bacterium]
MTNRIALALVLLIALLIAADYFLNDLMASIFLGRKFAELLEYLAFWR